MVPFYLEVLAKFGLCSNCSQKSDECSLARARKISAAAGMLGFSLKCTGNARSIICIGKIDTRNDDSLLDRTNQEQ